MNVRVREYREEDIPSMIRIWNEVVEEGNAFPQEECLTEETGKYFWRANLLRSSGKCFKRRTARLIHSASE